MGKKLSIVSMCRHIVLFCCCFLASYNTSYALFPIVYIKHLAEPTDQKCEFCHRSLNIDIKGKVDKNETQQSTINQDYIEKKLGVYYCDESDNDQKYKFCMKCFQDKVRPFMAGIVGCQLRINNFNIFGMNSDEGTDLSSMGRNLFVLKFYRDGQLDACHKCYQSVNMDLIDQVLGLNQIVTKKKKIYYHFKCYISNSEEIKHAPNAAVLSYAMGDSKTFDEKFFEEYKNADLDTRIDMMRKKCGVPQMIKFKNEEDNESL